jgi:formate-dependent nitrite reductase membrane component NrfD
VAVRKPELGTQPKVFYIGGSHATLRPEAAARPDADIFMWASQRPDETVGAGVGTAPNTRLAYDVAHTIPWGTDVALYLWTKSVSAGAMLVAAIAAVVGRFTGSTVTSIGAPLVALLFLAITGALLVVDLEHPTKFYTILTRPQWRSWLVRGAVILMAFGAVSVLWLVPLVLGSAGDGLYDWLGWLALPIAGAAACYTAFLFAQATGRELWATPLAAPHLVVQAAVAGSAALSMLATALPAPAAGLGGPSDVAWLRGLFCWSLAAHALLVAAELFTPHRTAHVARAVDTIVHGKYAFEFWVGAALVGVALPGLVLFASGAGVATALAGALALVGLYVWEYVWVFAGQSVPLS